MKVSNEKMFSILGWVATVTAVLMYVSYIPQLIANWNGAKGDYIQPFVAGLNCTLWVLYGLFKPNRDLPVAIANSPGIVFGFLTALLAFMNS